MFLYTISIRIYYFAIIIASLFNSKAKLMLKGRKSLFENIRLKISNNDKIIWIHCASLGEFEQGRSLIEKLKKEKPTIKILVTFFSPSGYEVRKNYPNADYIFYLPFDFKSNVTKFLDIVKPELVVFVKYEFWFNYISEIKKRNIPLILISGIFRKDQHFFKYYGTWFRKQLENFSFFFLQNQESADLLKKININNFDITGDTRFDRVLEISKSSKSFPEIKEFVGTSKALIAGSTWEPDEELILAYVNQNSNDLKLIIAPHLVDENHIESICKKISVPFVRYSKIEKQNLSDFKVLIIDNIGILSHVYQYGTIAYIGGAFGKGLHNILEAATFGLPVIFGPNYKKFQEAKDLLNLEGAFSIKNQLELNKHFDSILNDNELHTKTSKICKEYIQKSAGATDRIFNYLKNSTNLN